MKLQFARRMRVFRAGGGVWGMHLRGGAYKSRFSLAFICPEGEKKGYFSTKEYKMA